MASVSTSPQSIFIVGPTAVGKSAVTLQLAERLGGEIISADSMQVYRGLDIGTAKPSRAELEKVRHHLIDIVDLAELFDAAKFVAHAQAAVAEIESRGRRPIFCGGTGLYVKGLLEGLGEAPPADARIRAELEATPLEALLAELAERDPATFARIDQRNPRRVIRALEVIRMTGKPFSDQRARWNRDNSSTGVAAPAIVGLSRATEDLRSRIDIRVDQMFAAGLVTETEQLLASGLEQNPTAMQAIGYRQVVEHLRGERSLEETIALVKVRTRQFAKRQMTWFRRQLPVQWLEIPAGESVEETTARVEAVLANPGA